MKRLVPLGACLLAVLFLAAPSQGAIEKTFGDMSTSWGYYGIASPSQEGTTPWDYPPGNNQPANKSDQWGTPLFKVNDSTSGENAAYFDATTKLLHQVKIAYHNNGGSYWEVLKPGDLFIDIGGNGTWDYVARTPFFAQKAYFDATGTPTADGKTALLAKWNVYKFKTPLDYLNDQDNPGPPYQQVYVPYQVAANSGRADSATGGWTGFDIRDYHPWAINWDDTSTIDITKVTEATFSGWANLDGQPSSATGTSTWTFGSDLWTGGGNTTVRFGFTVNCANDVLVGEVVTPLGQIPEPASMAVWSVLAGAAVGIRALRRRKRHAR
jgi:hypothetical protein